MSSSDMTDYRLRQLERKMKGMQRQINLLNANQERTEAETDRRLRDLEIKAAVLKGMPQKTVAQIYDLSAARVSQIVKKVG
ncbi:hypothetical protein [Aeromonas salmonicida]|uniref:hypothetical protein n=1 Tax=Aeromonas salmonicida TaxID=645 RepID=UPI0028624677|nr:hypothetical protein [Aeromonas salmonicida]MDR7018285.1 DNA-directed RNA polymerase specialized sigma subunit [Aeromonas salmonicida]